MAKVPAAAPLPLAKVGEKVFDSMEKIPADFLAITYGSLLRQMLADANDKPEAVNEQLDAMGVRIGQRLVEEFAARSGLPPCKNFQSTAEAIAKVGLKMFLGITATVENLTAEQYSLVFDTNPLAQFVELPDTLKSTLWYSAILAGAIRGALSQVGILCDVTFARDTLRGDETNEIRIRYKARAKETFKTTD